MSTHKNVDTFFYAGQAAIKTTVWVCLQSIYLLFLSSLYTLTVMFFPSGMQRKYRKCKSQEIINALRLKSSSFSIDRLKHITCPDPVLECSLEKGQMVLSIIYSDSVKIDRL
jgi:hypothetical protein